MFYDIVCDCFVVFDLGFEDCGVVYFGDGNVYFMVYLIKDDFDYVDVIFNIVEDVVVELGGSFLVEYGIGKFKFLFMSCCKDFVVIVMMKVLK